MTHLTTILTVNGVVDITDKYSLNITKCYLITILLCNDSDIFVKINIIVLT